MASQTQWTWVWVNSCSWWWTGRPGVLRFMGSQRVGHDWATELNWTETFRLEFHLTLLSVVRLSFENYSVDMNSVLAHPLISFCLCLSFFFSYRLCLFKYASRFLFCHYFLYGSFVIFTSLSLSTEMWLLLLLLSCFSSIQLCATP